MIKLTETVLSSARIEYRIPIPMVVGSNPSGRVTKKLPSLCWEFFLIVNTIEMG